jgi:hypothetical protein
MLEMKIPNGLRVLVVLVVMLAGACTWVWARSAASESLAPTAVLTVNTRHPGNVFDPGAVGLSIEAEELATRDLSSSPKSLVALMRLLGPSVLRIGGNSLDHSWWTSDAEQPPAWATSVITPSDLVGLRELLVETDWRAILGVNFGHFDPTRAADETRIAQRILGSRLLAIEIGNEPNGYGAPSIDLRDDAYSVSTYLKELSAYSAAIHAISPTLLLYGPEVAAPTSWLTAIASDVSLPFAALTEHYYPTQYSVPQGLCKGTTVPTAHTLLSPQVRQQENTLLEMLVTAGQLAHRPTRISETNTTASCDASGGPNTGPVFASALWSLDWILRSVSAGVAGINFHGYVGLCPPNTFSPVCAPSNAAETRGQVIARPEYYGLLAASRLEGGRFIPTSLTAANPLPNLTAWATVAPSGMLRIAIDNLATAGPAQPVRIAIPGYSAGTGETLIGLSVEARGDIVLGGAPVSGAGQWRPRSVTLSRVGRSLGVVVRPASAMIITLRQKRPHG